MNETNRDTERTREARADAAATPLTRPNADGNSGRDYMDRARQEVEAMAFWRRSDDPDAAAYTARYSKGAEFTLGEAWRHPDAAKAMQAAGHTEQGMRRDLAVGRLDAVARGLSSPDPAMADKRESAAETQARVTRQARPVAPDTDRAQEPDRRPRPMDAADYWAAKVARGAGRDEGAQALTREQKESARRGMAQRAG